MADNVTADPGTGGAVFATDDIGGVHYPITKITIGALDAQTLLSGGNGATDAGTVRVTIASDTTGVLSVDDGGGSLTVDATALDIRALVNTDVVTAELSATDNAVLDSIDTNTTGLNNVIGTDGTAGPTSVISVGGTESGGNIQEVRVDADGHLQVDVLSGGGGGTANTISTNNSTTTPLGISGNFTGTGDDVSAYAAVSVQLNSDQDSATNGMTFEFSSDNTNWDDVYSFTYTASQGARRFQFPVTAQYFRVNYTNGGTGQTHFRVQTILHSEPIRTSIHRVEDNVSPDRSVELVKSVLAAQINGSGDFIPIQSSAGGVLKVGGSVEVDTWSAGTLTVTATALDIRALTNADVVTAELSATDNAVLDAIEANTDFGAVQGGGTEATALRVTIATDSTGVLSIDDNGASLTVDATDLDIRALTNTDVVTAELSPTDNAVLDNIDTNTLSVSTAVGTDGTLGPTGALSIGGTESGGNFQEVRVDTDGHLQVDVLSGGGGGTQDADDDAIAAGQTVGINVAMAYLYDGTDWSRAAAGSGAVNAQTQRVTVATDDSLNIRTLVNTDTVTAELSATDNIVLDNIQSNTTGLDLTVGFDGAAGPAAALSIGGTESGGNFQEVRVDTDGHLQVDVLSGGGSGPTDTDDDAVAAGQSPALNIAMAYMYDGTDWSRAASGTGVRTLQTQRVTIATDDIVPASQSGTWNITNVSGTVSLPTGAATESTLSTIDADTSILSAAIQTDDAAYTTGTDTGMPMMGYYSLSPDTVDTGDVGVLAMTNTRSLLVQGDGSMAVQEDGLALTALQDIQNCVVGPDNALSTSETIIQGLAARSAEPTAVANNDAVRALATLLGKQVTYPYAIPPSTWSYATATLGVTDTSDDEAKAAAGAGIRNYITSCQVINGHATVATEVVIKDGSTVIWRGWAEPTGGGVAAKFDPPLRGTANTAVNVANITTGSKTYFNLQGYVAAE